MSRAISSLFIFMTLFSLTYADLSPRDILNRAQHRQRYRRTKTLTSQWDNPTSGTPSEEFAGSSSLPAAALAKAALAGKHALNSYLISTDSSGEFITSLFCRSTSNVTSSIAHSVVYGDWENLPDVSIYSPFCTSIRLNPDVTGFRLLFHRGHGCRLRRQKFQRRYPLRTMPHQILTIHPKVQR